MLGDRRKEIQDRIAKRRRLESKLESSRTEIPWSEMKVDNQEQYGYESVSFESGNREKEHPLFKKEYFLFKILGAACLFLIVAVLFRHPSPQFEPARNAVSTAMKQEFQFAAVSSWYEDTFGKPIAFLPSDNTNTNVAESDGQFAQPVSGKITESFETNGEGIILETGSNSKVEALNGGLVIFAGTKEGLGKTIVIQHVDKSESWYGELENINVTLFETVKKGAEIGQVTASQDGSKGSFYLAIKKDDAFIDPKKVISFE